MNGSYTSWRKADESSTAIPDSDDDDLFRNNQKRPHKLVIEDSDSEEDTEDESTKGDSGQHSIDESIEGAEKHQKSIEYDGDSSTSELIVDTDDGESAGPEKSVSRKKRTSNKIVDESDSEIYSDEEISVDTESSESHDDSHSIDLNNDGRKTHKENLDKSDIIVTSRSEGVSDEESSVDGDAAEAHDDSQRMDLNNDEHETKNHRKSHLDLEHNVLSEPEAQNVIKAGGSRDRDTSVLTISDHSDADDDSTDSDPSKNAHLASGQGASRSLTPTLNSEDEAAVMPFIRKEIGVGNIDPLVEQRRAMLTCNIEKNESRLAKSKILLNTANLDSLPDKGDRLKLSIDMQEAELERLRAQMDSLPKYGTPAKPQSKPMNETNPIAQSPWKIAASLQPAKPLGKKALETQQREQALTEERIKDLHGSLNARPGEDELAQDPKGLKITLMPHQQHALAWLLWREQQRPHGGILADDMGLGKTLTMISLILTSLDNNDDDDDDSEDEWVQRKKSIRPKGGSLVVCPASVLNQWDAEIQRRVKRGKLKVALFHGNNRESVTRRLAQNDVVITTYNLLSREHKSDSDSVLYKVNWKRIILDEAHIVRNHKSQASEAVCNVFARSRWALTGTPIQNKELDLYALLKFLRCSPFDDLLVWKRWVDNKNAQGHARLTTVMKTLMLRRTKQELLQKGGLGALPDKNLEEIHVTLDPDEQLVYEKVLVFSRTLFGQFLHQRAEKNHMYELNAGKFDDPTFLQKSKDTQFTKAQNQLLARHADVKAHEILVLLLRLRQICCQPSLIHAMLDDNDLHGNDLEDEEGVNIDVMNGIGALKLEDNENADPEDEIGVDHRVVQNLLTTKNPVFNPNRLSSKMRVVLDTIRKILDKGDKMVVVSQWTSMLEIVRSQLDSIPGASYAILSGNVPVKSRQHLMDSFNRADEAPHILLLSLTAGGVGLNLIGGNHLLLLDIHWNPQLEAQAQDRIYRVGQNKSVYIYKFICLDTVEQRIKALQDKKLALAEGVLTGAGIVGAAKLTLDDMKSLFSL